VGKRGPGTSGGKGAVGLGHAAGLHRRHFMYLMEPVEMKLDGKMYGRMYGRKCFTHVY
jgi:hypothetical protein